MPEPVEVVRPLAGSVLPEVRHVPFGAGNLVHASHGAHSERLVSVRTEEVRAEYLERFPWLGEAHSVRLDLFARDMARYNLLDEFVQDVVEGRRSSSVQGRGRPRSGSVEAVPEYVWSELRGLSKALGDHATALGLDPASFARIMRDSSFARQVASEQLGALAATGRALRRVGGGDGDGV